MNEKPVEDERYIAARMQDRRSLRGNESVAEVDYGLTEVADALKGIRRQIKEINALSLRVERLDMDIRAVKEDLDNKVKEILSMFAEVDITTNDLNERLQKAEKAIKTLTDSVNSLVRGGGVQ